MPCYQLDEDLWFPPLEAAEDYGLLAVGGDLSPERLLLAYSLGIFPWFNPGEPILWWSPDPRCVLFPSELHVSRSMKKFMRKGLYRVSIDENFAGVVYWCRRLRKGLDGSGTWITPEMEKAYLRLHELGFAHSVECWDGDELVGGVYGVCLGYYFCGESMFSRRTNASKLVLIHLVKKLAELGFELLDCQQTTDHLVSLGATEISRLEFQQHLRIAEVPPYGPLLSRFSKSVV
ncbi:leucyl/phenylalanyl-tRNA--protein transferase [Malonomonas rubra DSM 5091]|uniref:Leucyl/phenylalanyl-tRNA--protein transferase n=1 Tax=Malonomonas rubra DSM 5091 TaxID=1122189 RepID=A0A1M6EA30_MALRU|nr:leucyl/phenylalanyl-tRNA--protein transferase [Malonomonas rubra]SHI82336.1 leucyl/phenylalanyl-tRNA--protein transferase [Malonomonas rubra DSM 5091]